MHSGEQLGTIALREASTMIQQTGMGQSTPNLATKKILQGHHSDSPTEARGREPKDEGFHREPWP